jgi:hypothetical protein
MGRWTLALKNREHAPTKETPDRTDIITVLDLARSYDFGIAIIVGGGWRVTDDDERELMLGEVVGGDEAHWRAFAGRASDAQLQEAKSLLQSWVTAA